MLVLPRYVNLYQQHVCLHARPKTFVLLVQHFLLFFPSLRLLAFLFYTLMPAHLEPCDELAIL